MPDGQYPLQIASVTLDVEGTEQPWTRITETADGSGSMWQGGEQIGVRIGTGTPGTYAVQADGTVSPVTPAYWQSTATTYVTAWYPTNETIDLSDQTGGLAYVLQAGVENAAYNQSVSLNFTHKLAKVRVVLDGTQARQVTQVEVNNYTRCTNYRGTLISHGSDQGWIKMHQADATTWEANVVPGTQIDPANFIRLNGTAMATNLTGLPSTLGAGQMYTVSLTVGEEITELTADNRNITQDGYYRVRGSFPYNITISGNIAPTLYLENTSMNITNDSHAINIESGNPTIYISGTNNISVNEDNYGAGIYVAQGSSVTITGTSEDDVLVVTGGSGSSGIGGYTSSDYYSHPCGNITIENITVRATSNIPTVTGGYAAAIGACGDQTVGSITISNAVVYANGGGSNDYGGAGIGGGVSSLFGFGQTEFDISIADSEIHVSKGCPYASYIGAGGMRSEQTNYKIIPSAKITNSHIYDESGNEMTQ